MALHIDLKYLSQVSNKLNLFRQRDTYVFNFRCPVCGDSHENQQKTRGYVFKKSDRLFFKCHNCDSPIGFGGLIKFLDGAAYSEYVMESYLDRNPKPITKTNSPNVVDETVVSRQHIPLRKLSELPSNHKAVVWFNKRKIPSKFLSEFYFVERFEEAKCLNEIMAKKAHGKEPRIIIPFWNRENKLIGVACREIENHTAKKYINVKFGDEDMIYGLDRMDVSKPIYVTEGPIDSLFLDNCIAVGNTALMKVVTLGIPASQFILVYDDQPKHHEVVHFVGRAIEAGFSVVIWDSGSSKKLDINELVIAGKNPVEIVKRRTFSGLLAKLEYCKWKKI